MSEIKIEAENVRVTNGGSVLSVFLGVTTAQIDSLLRMLCSDYPDEWDAVNKEVGE